MTTDQLKKLKYPIGEFEMPKTYSKSDIKNWINTIKEFPNKIKNITNSLTETELNYRYRPDGWSIKQVIHHCADSHMNSIIRFKLALTEDCPTIRPYFEDRFAKLPDYETSIESAIKILEGIHYKLGVLFDNFTEIEFQKEFKHPEHGKVFTLVENIAIYAWHSNHHFAHIEQALNHKGKFD